jgi:RNA polymerase sigma-70 factor (ECF subfamily)
MLHSRLQNVARLVDVYLDAGCAGAAPERNAAARDDVDGDHVDRLDRTLAAICARGRTAHPKLAVEDLTFAAHLGRCGADIDPSRPADIHAEDLYLCCAALQGEALAVRTLRDRHRPVLASYLRRIDTSTAFLDEVEQRLWNVALTGAADAMPKLASYSGRGPLAAWVGIAGQRIALTMRRSEDVEKRALDRVATEAHLMTRDPEMAFVKEHLREPFQRAILQALELLDNRQRMIYTLNVVDGLNIDRIAAIYRVSRSTVTRWMARARADIVTAAQRLLRDEIRLSNDEFDSLARMLTSQLDLSVSVILRPRA